jgi:hypothetical protein
VHSTNECYIKIGNTKENTIPDEKMSPVRNPLFKVSITAVSILFAALSSPRPYFNNIAALSTVAKGFALSYTTTTTKPLCQYNLLNK